MIDEFGDEVDEFGDVAAPTASVNVDEFGDTVAIESDTRPLAERTGFGDYMKSAAVGFAETLDAPLRAATGYIGDMIAGVPKTANAAVQNVFAGPVMSKEEWEARPISPALAMSDPYGMMPAGVEQQPKKPSYDEYLKTKQAIDASAGRINDTLVGASDAVNSVTTKIKEKYIGSADENRFDPEKQAEIAELPITNPLKLQKIYSDLVEGGTNIGATIGTYAIAGPVVATGAVLSGSVNRAHNQATHQLANRTDLSPAKKIELANEYTTQAAGVETLINMIPIGQYLSPGKWLGEQGLKKVIATYAADAGINITAGAATTIAQGMIERATVNPELTNEEIADRAKAGMLTDALVSPLATKIGALSSLRDQSAIEKHYASQDSQFVRDNPQYKMRPDEVGNIAKYANRISRGSFGLPEVAKENIDLDTMFDFSGPLKRLQQKEFMPGDIDAAGSVAQHLNVNTAVDALMQHTGAKVDFDPNGQIKLVATDSVPSLKKLVEEAGPEGFTYVYTNRILRNDERRLGAKEAAMMDSKMAIEAAEQEIATVKQKLKPAEQKFSDRKQLLNLVDNLNADNNSVVSPKIEEIERRIAESPRDIREEGLSLSEATKLRDYYQSEFDSLNQMKPMAQDELAKERLKESLATVKGELNQLNDFIDPTGKINKLNELNQFVAKENQKYDELSYDVTNKIGDIGQVDRSNFKKLTSGVKMDGAKELRVEAGLTNLLDMVADMYHKSGYLSDESRANWKQDRYAGLRRVMEGDDFQDRNAGRIDVHKYRKGSDVSGTINPVTQVQDLLQDATRVFYHEKAKRDIVSFLVSKNGVGDPNLVKLVPKEESKNGTFFWKNGQKQYFDIQDPKMAAVIGGMDMQKVSKGITKHLAAYNSMRQKLMTAGPLFRAKAWVRGQREAYFQRPEYNNLARAAVDNARVIMDKEFINNMRLNAGVFMTQNNLGKGAESDWYDSTFGKKSAIARGVEWWEGVGAYSENMPRLAVARNVLDNGGSWTEAANAALNTGPAYQNRGSSSAVQKTLSMVPFGKTRINALVSWRDNVRKSPKAWATKVALGALTSVGLRLALHEMLNERKENGENTVLDKTVGGLTTGVSIPIPFTNGFTIQDKTAPHIEKYFTDIIPSLIVDKYKGTYMDGEASKHALNFIIGTVGVNPFPGPFQQAWYTSQNRDPYSDTPIVSDYTILSKPRDMWEGKSDLWNAVGKEIGQSGAQLNWWSSSILGHELAGYINTVANYVSTYATDSGKDDEYNWDAGVGSMILELIKENPNPKVTKYDQGFFEMQKGIMDDIAREMAGDKEQAIKARMLALTNPDLEYKRVQLKRVQKDIDKLKDLIKKYPENKDDLELSISEQRKAAYQIWVAE